MDEFGLFAVSEFYQTGGCGRRIQRKIYDQSDGFTRRECGDFAKSQPQNLSQFFSSAASLAIYGNSVSQIILDFKFQYSNLRFRSQFGIWNLKTEIYKYANFQRN